MRPMMEKVRAALFDMLWHFNALHGRALDMFAGSGAVGIEALSRGAEQADFVELNPVSVRTIQRNLDTLELADRGRVHRRRAEDVIANPSLLGYAGPYDLISVTPPYIEVKYDELARGIASSSLVGPGTVVVFEHPGEVEMPDSIGPLERLRDRKYGRTRIAIYEYPYETDPHAAEEWEDEGWDDTWEEWNDLEELLDDDDGS